MSSPRIYRRIRVGDDTPAYCGRCKAERTHTVVALKPDTEPAEVVCRTCDSRHRYRAGEARSAGATSDAARRTTGAGQRRTTAPPISAAKPARPYSTRETYAEGELIEHPRYGRGEIVASRGGKIDVRFGDGLRTLVHAG
ncbi:MAG: hypothetical protein M3268_04495 [Acidobacteriota bacterium]|nr:hypothetical protein [Acidobacteriota bacterium]